MAIPRTRPDGLPAILSYGFRPFFLFGAIYGGLTVLAWVPMLTGALETSSLFTPVDWHAHEMLFGFLPAIITGFLLTAIPNWTGRLPVQGYSLLALVLLWAAGRVAIYFSADIGWLAAMAIDCAFLFAVAAAAGIEIVAGRNWRNLKVLAPVLVLFLANVLFHVEAQTYGITDLGRRLALSAALVLIMIIGGRIIPSFTRNWLARENPGRLPIPFGRFDGVVIVVSAVALGLWTFMPGGPLAGLLLLAAGALNVARLARWAGERAWRDGLVVVLHVAYAFVPLGLIVSGLAALFPTAVPAVAGIHIFGIGAIGAMTLAVMTRSTLGHTGRELKADRATALIYVAIVLSTVLRFIAAFWPGQTPILHVSATLWIAAFLGFALHYGPMVLRPRLKPRQPNPRPA
ncbi:MAG: NnrS family protein [Aquamicrobium sp.]|uniref:NnrS family protein n=1 Tax=Aquamicrobium sp. TaxID=1872579 RepID=UPI00349EA9B8|nr:NnrS family protein [Aquamicrobium sp.]